MLYTIYIHFLNKNLTKVYVFIYGKSVNLALFLQQIHKRKIFPAKQFTVPMILEYTND